MFSRKITSKRLDCFLLYSAIFLLKIVASQSEAPFVGSFLSGIVIELEKLVPLCRKTPSKKLSGKVYPK